jgi:hypothetical protein
MSKKNEKANKPITIDESIEDLKNQIVQYNTLLIKAQGALEVIQQIKDSQGE